MLDYFTIYPSTRLRASRVRQRPITTQPGKIPVPKIPVPKIPVPQILVPKIQAPVASHPAQIIVCSKYESGYNCVHYGRPRDTCYNELEHAAPPDPSLSFFDRHFHHFAYAFWRVCRAGHEL
jgi:hypothetical protein